MQTLHDRFEESVRRWTRGYPDFTEARKQRLIADLEVDVKRWLVENAAQLVDE